MRPTALSSIVVVAVLGCAAGESSPDISAVSTGDGSGSSTRSTNDDDDDGSGPGGSDTTGADGSTPDDGDEECGAQSYYFDGDGDGHGDPLGEVVACMAPPGHVPNGDDCDDTDPSRSPSLTEVCDGKDNDCDGTIDEDVAVDGRCEGCTIAQNAGRTYFFCTEPRTFDEARAYCMGLGGDLHKLDDDAENAFLMTAPIPSSAKVGRYFNGLNDLDNEGTFVWTDGTAPTVVLWLGLEPNDAGGAEDCVELDTDQWGWNDIGCATPHPFICESPPP